MQNIVEEFNRLTGVGPSLAERASTDPMLRVLAKAFSVKAVKPADLKFIQYRKVGHGVELEDTAARFGGILTSVEPKDADPKALMTFLKKHGARTFKAESIEECLLTELKFDDSKIDPKKHGKPGKPYYVVQSHNSGTIYKPGVFKKADMKKRAGEYAREIAAKTKKLNPRWAWIKIDMVRDVPPKVSPRGLAFSQDVRASMYRYINGVWKHKDGPVKISGLNESLEEGNDVAMTILKQMGGNRVKAMLGVKQFIAHGDALSFKFSNRKASKGNYVKITLRPDDTYDMEFSRIVKYEAKSVKKYKGIHADQLKPIFEKQTGLRLSL